MSQSCPNCGTLNLDSYRFCSNCGAPLGSSTQAMQPAASDAPPSADPSTQDTVALPSPPLSYAPPPAAPASQESVPTSPIPSPLFSFSPPPSQESAPSSPFSSTSEPAYVVKTSPDATGLGSPAPAAPANVFEPPPPPPTLTPGTPTFGQQEPPVQAQPEQYTGPQGYNPGAGARKEGGVYTPYAAGTTTSVEQPKEPRSWLIPVIVIAALLLVGLGALGFIATQQNKGTGPTVGGNQTGGGAQASPAPTSQSGAFATPAKPDPTVTDLPASASEEDRVKAVVRRSNEQQIKAWQELNTDVLSENYTGQALAENIQEVQQLQQKNLYAKPVNAKLDILDVNITGDSATAHTVEVWTVTYYDRSTNAKTGADGPTTYNETYHLTKVKGKWLINKLEIPTPEPATPTRSGT